MKDDNDRLTEFQKCHGLDNNALFRKVQCDPRTPLWPAPMVLLERVEVKPEKEKK